MQLLTTILGALSVVAVIAAPQPEGNEKEMFYISPSGQSSRLSKQQWQSLVSSAWKHAPLAMWQFYHFYSCIALLSNTFRPLEKPQMDLILLLPGSNLNIPASCRPFNLSVGLSHSSHRRQLQRK